jgi:hypothetical protein
MNQSSSESAQLRIEIPEDNGLSVMTGRTSVSHQVGTSVGKSEKLEDQVSKLSESKRESSAGYKKEEPVRSTVPSEKGFGQNLLKMASKYLLQEFRPSVMNIEI